MPSLLNLTNFSNFEEIRVHSWFKYREGYSVKLVEHFIKDNGDNESYLLDPFCGSGSSLIAAIRSGVHSTGIDVNPMSVFISSVKTRFYTQKDLEHISKLSCQILSVNGRPTCPPPALKIIHKIFHPEILETILKVKSNIFNIENKKYRDFLFLGWLSILESVSNTYKEGNGIKYRSTKRTKNGYVKVPDEEWQPKLFGYNKKEFTLNKLKLKYNLMIGDLIELLKSSIGKEKEPEVIKGNATSLENYIDDGKVSLTIFSPPYANCFDYCETYKVELWMGDFVKNYTDLKNLRRGTIRSHINSDLGSPTSYSALPEIRKLNQMMDTEKLWDKRIPSLVNAYFIDMEKVLENIYYCLKPGGRCVIVIGNSSYSGVLIPTDLLLACIGKKLGYEKSDVLVIRHLTTSSQQKKNLEPLKEYLKESIVVLKKSSKKRRKTTEKSEHFIKKVEQLPLDVDINRKQRFFITSNDVAYLTHTFHKYPSKFIPQVPRWAIKKCINEKSRNVLDPFCGSGTTLVEALLLGHNAFGIDLDPLAKLITKVKITPLKEEKINKTCEYISNEILKRKTGKFLPITPNLRHWFRDEVINDLAVIRDTIEEFKEEKDIYDFLIICLSSIIRKVSNADDQSQKTYVSHTNIKKHIEAKPYFIRILNAYKDRLTCFSKIVSKKLKFHVFESGDAREVDKVWKKYSQESVNLAVTSPPYIKAIDYIYTQMAEYFWIGDIFGLADQPSQNKYKENYIGTKQVSAEIYKECKLTGYKSIDSLIEKIYDIDKKHAYITFKFFEDMRANLESTYRILEEGSHYVVVIGNCNVSGINIATHEIIAEIGQSLGYSLKNLFCYEIRNRYMRFPRQGRGGYIKDDWIVNLKKS